MLEVTVPSGNEPSEERGGVRSAPKFIRIKRYDRLVKENLYRVIEPTACSTPTSRFCSSSACPTRRDQGIQEDES